MVVLQKRRSSTHSPSVCDLTHSPELAPKLTVSCSQLQREPCNGHVRGRACGQPRTELDIFQPVSSKLPSSYVANHNHDSDMLNVHGVLEHDASLSRSDHYFGNNHVFNQSVFDESKKFWTTEIMDRYQMSNAKLARQIQSRVCGPMSIFYL